MAPGPPQSCGGTSTWAWRCRAGAVEASGVRLSPRGAGWRWGCCASPCRHRRAPRGVVAPQASSAHARPWCSGPRAAASVGLGPSSSWGHTVLLIDVSGGSVRSSGSDSPPGCHSWQGGFGVLCGVTCGVSPSSAQWAAGDREGPRWTEGGRPQPRGGLQLPRSQQPSPRACVSDSEFLGSGFQIIGNDITNDRIIYLNGKEQGHVVRKRLECLKLGTEVAFGVCGLAGVRGGRLGRPHVGPGVRAAHAGSGIPGSGDTTERGVFHLCSSF